MPKGLIYAYLGGNHFSVFLNYPSTKTVLVTLQSSQVCTDVKINKQYTHTTYQTYDNLSG